MTGKTLLLASLGLVLAAPPLRAEVVIADVKWQLAIQVKKHKRDYHDIRRWLFPPTDKAKIRVRATLYLINRSPKSESALLLKYAFGARLRRIGGDDPGIWTVPFHLDERRIPIIKGGERRKINLPINRVALNAYLKRMYRAGYWPDSFKVHVMVEPRIGEGFADRIQEVVLPVIWKTSFSKGGDDERP